MNDMAHAVLRLLEENKIDHTLAEHPAVFNMEELYAQGLEHCDAIAKNLLVRDQKKRFYWLLVLYGEKRADLKALKAQGTVRHIGFSSHTPSVANRILDTGLVDMMMFSINPMYDYGHGEFSIGSASERYRLYTRCEKEGVGISVMKPFNAGQLLDAKKSPFGQALTPAQCIQYALDRPAVLTVMQGAANVEELKRNLSYLDASAQERDYSVIGSFTPKDMKGTCVYCKHCHPCPAGLDIGLINKYYDLSRLGDVLAKEHYLTLEKTASDCLQCGHCNSRCPFSVDQMARMEEIQKYFGR